MQKNISSDTNRSVRCSMKERNIKIAITRVVGNTRYSSWRVGITSYNNLAQRRSQHGNPKHWHYWRADTVAMARKVEDYFIAKGMKGHVGGGKSPNYVYIF